MNRGSRELVQNLTAEGLHRLVDKHGLLPQFSEPRTARCAAVCAGGVVQPSGIPGTATPLSAVSADAGPLLRGRSNAHPHRDAGACGFGGPCHRAFSSCPLRDPTTQQSRSTRTFSPTTPTLRTSCGRECSDSMSSLTRSTCRRVRPGRSSPKEACARTSCLCTRAA